MQIIIFIFFLLGCGYKPSSVYQDKVIGNKVKIEVSISAKNPREGIFLKDALKDVVYSLGKDIRTKNYSTLIKIIPISYSINPLNYDKNGIPYVYRSKVILKTIISNKQKKFSYTIKGIYDFTTSTNSLVTENIKLDAYKKASINALNELFAKIAENGVNYDN